MLVVLFVALAGCSRTPTQEELPGLYVFEQSDSRQEIGIKSDGSYTNSYIREGILVWSDVGRWEYEKSGNVYGVTFSLFHVGIPDDYKTRGRGFWFVPAEKDMFGSIALCFDLDLNRCFQRSNGARNSEFREEKGSVPLLSGCYSNRFSWLCCG